jgi:hypothetical protein
MSQPSLSAFIWSVADLLSGYFNNLTKAKSYCLLPFCAVWTILLPLSNSTESFQIECFLNAETAQLDALVAEPQSAIALLQEGRTAVITTAVTGQIDVR